VAAALRSRNVTLAHRHFDGVLEEAAAEDFLYLDPPYSPSSATARFTNYTAEGFGPNDQERLRDLLVTLAERGCHVMMSNSTAPEITQLYGAHAGVARAGLRCYSVPARRAINSNAGRRGNVAEYLITNISRR
jgi:DNA adenine methylase